MPAADSVVTIVVAVTTALGGQQVVSGFLNRRKTSADAEASAADAVKSKADATQVLTEAAGVLVKPLTEQIGQLRREVNDLHRRDHARDILAAQHASWDRQVTERFGNLLDLLGDLLAGRRVTPDRIRELEQPLGDPPPLYVPPSDPS